MRLVFAGTPAAAVPALQLLIDSHHEILSVLTQPPSRTGRGRTLIPSAVELLARDHGIEVLAPEKVASAAEILRALEPDCIPIVAYGQIIPADMLAIPAFGWVNLHFSLLPALRGAAPVQHAIWGGDQMTGATTFLLDQGMDTGPVLGTMVEAILPSDTAGSLLHKLSESGAVLLHQTIDALEQGLLTPVAQPSDGVTYAPKIEKADARINWEYPAREVDRRIRAMTPAPGAWTTSPDGDSFVIDPIVLIDSDHSLGPGEIRIERNRVLVGTATTAVALGMLTPQGRKSMKAADWARGLRQPQERFM
ncbi:MAG: methionyl-tRNA formyltransferase [Candidatus Nanopelagicales bacterium]